MLTVSARTASRRTPDIPDPVAPLKVAGAADDLFDWIFSSQLPFHNYLYNDIISIILTNTILSYSGVSSVLRPLSLVLGGVW